MPQDKRSASGLSLRRSVFISRPVYMRFYGGQTGTVTGFVVGKLALWQVLWWANWHCDRFCGGKTGTVTGFLVGKLALWQVFVVRKLALLQVFLQSLRFSSVRVSGVPRNIFRGGGYARNLGGSTNSVEDRRQRELGSGGGSVLVKCSTQFANEWNPYSD
jgi:hypothetical protein